MQEATPENLPPPAADAKVGPGETADQTLQADPAAATTPPDTMPSPEELLKAAELKAAEHHDAWLRAKAETENLRRRAQEDVTKAHKFAAEKFAGELLAVKDSLEAALANETQTVDALKAGVELTLKQLVAAFEKSAVKELNPLGEKFDPHFHQAIAMVEAAQEANTVVSVLQKGYALHDRILRPALVTVAKPKS
ncbi:MAG: nucleotide exchange factor GrpE [Pseudomonadota bacterium]